MWTHGTGFRSMKAAGNGRLSSSWPLLDRTTLPPDAPHWRGTARPDIAAFVSSSVRRSRTNATRHSGR